jgi:hypothetical protein
LKDNGTIFPRIEYPTKFGDFDVIGASAKTGIPPSRAFVFIPHKIIITGKKARYSEIGFIFKKHKAIFKSHEDGEDHILYLFIMYEKLKNKKSFW